MLYTVFLPLSETFISSPLIYLGYLFAGIGVLDPQGIDLICAVKKILHGAAYPEYQTPEEAT